MAVIKDSVFPEGSLVLVISSNGFLSSNVVDQLLHYGFRVRGTVRDLEKNAHLLSLFSDKYGKGKFELVEVKDLLREDAYNEAIKCADAVVNLASIVTFSSNPHDVVTPSVDLALIALKAAYAEPSVKRFVQTSSSAATGPAIAPDGKTYTVTKDSFNEHDIKLAWEEPHVPEKAVIVYSASKTAQELAVWKFHKENQQKRPDLVVNTGTQTYERICGNWRLLLTFSRVAVLPNMNFGPSLDEKNLGHTSTAKMAIDTMRGEASPLFAHLINQDFVDVRDTGRLHVAAVALPDVQNERIFAFGGPFSWDDILEVVRKAYPQKTWPANFSRGNAWIDVEPRGRAEKLLQRLGQPGWVSFENSILANVPSDLRA
ncbi:hypothetical protein S7711_10172 [Stachybotrys chartarum IBT 7711]|uniref:NAD-dependent epimerase/dehydratase domain-containing protein n=1 Tax=Stachybotrys chartarum (strain CBS 109288 / IBT 7711) TaxID=1280523 RepID=A0A084B9W9_STACB|nr:hypothetical protein S7711_10172 [Stachybotrys chartarum IBT 7711]